MLRATVGYICGAFSMFAIWACYIQGYPVFGCISAVAVFAVLLFWAHKHHTKKRDEYYDKLRGKKSYWS